MKIWATCTFEGKTSEVGIEYDENTPREVAMDELRKLAADLFQGELDHGDFYKDKQLVNFWHSA